MRLRETHEAAGLLATVGLAATTGIFDGRAGYTVRVTGPLPAPVVEARGQTFETLAQVRQFVRANKPKPAPKPKTERLPL